MSAATVAATACPEWCTDHVDELGPEVHPEDRAVLHSREWLPEEYLRVGVREFVYASGEVGERAVELRESEPGTDWRRCHWLTQLSGDQARALASALLEAADLIDAAGGYLSGVAEVEASS